MMSNPPRQSFSECLKHLYKSLVLYFSKYVLSGVLFLARYGGFVMTHAPAYSGGFRRVSLFCTRASLGSMSYASYVYPSPNQSRRSPCPANGSTTREPGGGFLRPSKIYTCFTV